MESKRGKGGDSPPSLLEKVTLKKFLEVKTEILTEELTDLRADILTGEFDKEIHDEITYITAQLNLIREIKSICNNRGRY